MKIDLGSKIENFMRDVLENGSDKEEAPTESEIHDAQNKNMGIHENPAKKKFGKFLLLGLTVLSLAGPALAQDNQFEHSLPGTFQNEVAEVQATSVNAGYVGNNIHIATHILHENVGSNYEKIQDLSETTNNSLTHDNGVCDVNITYSQDGRSAFLGYTDEMAKLSSPQTEAQLKLNREVVLLHEMSHCEFAKIHNPLLVDGNAQLQEQVNYFFKYNASFNSDERGSASSMISTLNENFADTYAIIQMIKIHGLTPDMTQLIHSMGAQRAERTLTQGEDDVVEAHATQNAIKEILEPATLAKIQATNDPEALKHIALEIANHSVGKMYSTYHDITQNTHSLSSFEDGALSMILNRIAQHYTQSAGPQTSVQHPFDDANSSFAVKVSDMVMAKLNLKDLNITASQINSKGIDFTLEQNNKIYYLIQDVVSDDLRPEALQMRQVDRDFNAYINKSFSPVQADYLNSKNTQVEVAEKIFAVQDNYISQEGTASQKASLLARINQQREVNQNNQIAQANSQEKATDNSASTVSSIKFENERTATGLVSKIQQLREVNNAQINVNTNTVAKAAQLN